MSLLNRTINNATQDDQLVINKFLNQDHLIHRHLDWFNPLEWIGYQPYLIERIDNRIQAIFCAAPEVKNAAWIRLFGVKDNQHLEDSWERLLSKSITMLKEANITQLAALGIKRWMLTLLKNAGFAHQQNIVVLEWQRDIPIIEIIQPEITIRPMHEEDLPQIEQIDHLAFDPLWQNSRLGLAKAYRQKGISSVAIKDDQIVGYQISTTLTIQGHLARLAVHPGYQRQHIADAILHDLLQRFIRRGVWCVTVNTQSDNQPSLALYQKYGFKPNQEVIPVYQLNF